MILTVGYLHSILMDKVGIKVVAKTKVKHMCTHTHVFINVLCKLKTVWMIFEFIELLHLANSLETFTQIL